MTAWLVSLRFRNYERGQPDDRSTTRTNAKRRMADFRNGVWMRTLLRDPAAGVMHACIYFGFLGLLLATIIAKPNIAADVPLDDDGQGYAHVSFAFGPCPPPSTTTCFSFSS